MEETLNLICGLPDNAQVRVLRLHPTIEFGWGGTPSFINETATDKRWFLTWVGPASPSQSVLKPGPIVNYIADPDQCGIALRAASEAARTIRRPWFNHPDRIKATTRDGVSDALKGIPGVHVPKVVRCKPDGVEDIQNTIRENGFDYPVILRSVGAHNGATMVRIDSHDDTLSFMSALCGKELYITQFVDFSDPDGLYRKYRVVIIGGKILFASLYIAKGWKIHTANRIWTDATIAEERDVIETFSSVFLPKIQSSVDEIYERLGLDYFGIDFSLRPDGSMLIFEANAVMDILSVSKLEPNIWVDSTELTRRALLDLLDRPEQWFASR